ncbi:RxLR effector protein [Phytophthora megakarya]|uniref:RxLR effector protein n=1 Tax=Phytophthora megakarya TaxID=4795 RepID=A0A225ULC0_9STRA|nr:RxLR effector protein [Phytophthora megakarya]
MRFIVLLVVVTFNFSFSATSALNQDAISKNTPSSQSQTTRPAGNDESEGGEERGIAPGTSKLLDLDKKTFSLVKFDNLLSNKLLILIREKPEKVFNIRFGLGKAGDNIGEKRKIIQWFRYARDYRAKLGDDQLPEAKIYDILAKTSETKRAMLFQSLKDIPDVKDLATAMQKYQIQLWVNQNREASWVANTLEIALRKRVKRDTNPMYSILEEFMKLKNTPTMG